MSAEAIDSQSYWLFKWLESHKIKTTAKASMAISSTSAINELRDRAQEWTESAIKPIHGVNLLAGTGLRLDDDLSCPSPVCRRRQVDILFRHAWHYFDRIFLPDWTGELLLNPPKEWNDDYIREVLLGSIDISLYLLQFGASPLIQYYSQPESSVQKVKEAIGFECEDIWSSAWFSVEEDLLANGVWKIRRIGSKKFAINYMDPILEIDSNFIVKLGKGVAPTEENILAQAAHEVLHSHIFYFERDLIARQTFGGHLGSNVWSHERVLSYLSCKNYKDALLKNKDALLKIKIPSLKNIPIKELISLRLSEKDAFLSFQVALTRAAREMLNCSNTIDSSAISTAIVNDIINPELASIRKRLRSAERALAKKTAVSIVLSAMSTTCGLLSGIPMTGLAGIGVLLSGMNAASSKYLDEKQAVERSDMFFLWKALSHVK